MFQRISLTIVMFFILLTGLNMEAQKTGKALIDSLSNRISFLKNDTEKVLLLCNISYEYQKINPSSGIKSGYEALLLADRIAYPFGQGLACLSLASNYNILTKQSAAVSYALRAADIFSEAAKPDLECAAYLTCTFTSLFLELGESRKYFDKARKLFPLSVDSIWIIRNLGSIGNMYRNFGQADSAEMFIDLSARLASGNHMKFEYYLAKRWKGQMAEVRGDLDSAYGNFRECLAYFEMEGFDVHVLKTLNYMANVRTAQFNRSNGEKKEYLSENRELLSRSFELAEKIGDNVVASTSALALSSYYEFTGDMHKAFHFHELSTLYFEKVWGVDNLKLLSRLNLANEQKVRDQEIAMLRYKNRQQLLILLLFISFTLVLLLMAYFIVRSRRKLKKTNLVLNQKNEEIRRILKELEHTNKELEGTVQELDAFSYSVSHDLRAPVRRIEALAGMVTEDFGESLNDEGRALLDRIGSSSVQMNQLIDDMLNLSRITRAALKKSDCDLSRLSEEIGSELKTLHGNKSLRFEVEQGIQVNADPGLMRIVLQNLLDNAFKYSSRNESPEIIVSSETRDGKTFILVSDNGAGFDMGKAGRLFTPFQRMHSDEEFKGTGIGLATVKRIIMKHGGFISVQSEPGRGTTFSFTLE
jgi:signal transduction histidine kinase